MTRAALVTGASRGIGRAIAVELGRSGHRVACCYSSDAAGADETCSGVLEAGGEGHAVGVDVGDAQSVDAAFTEVEEKLGPVEVLVNNAGVTADGLLARMKDEQWEQVLRTNLTGAFHTIRRATPKMMRGRWGRIVNISSVSGHTGAPGQVNYSAAKAGLVGLSRAVARELAPRGITCNVVAPGPIVTAMTEDMPAEWHAVMEATVPLGRLGTPEEVGALVGFLASEAAGYVTGALVPVDGGLGMGH
ncbi:MAG: 3-oxoacyl-[acyl-carrier-protein] reductase [Acidimicrobiia bacterium]